MRPGTGTGSGYVEFEIPKAKGGTRRIAAPRAPLRKVQRTILDKILAQGPDARRVSRLRRPVARR